MTFALEQTDSQIEVSAAGHPLFTYVTHPDTVRLESPKPYLHPIRTLGGDVVSLFRPHDHVWHKGIAWSLPNVGDDNFWGGPTYVHGEGYVQQPNNGSAEHQRFTTVEADAAGATIAHDLLWRTEAGAEVISEHRTIRARLADDAWVLSFETEMTNVSGAEISIGSPTTRGRENAGYGGLFWRGPRSFSDGTLHSPAGSGGEELRGTRAPWMGYTGRHDSVDRASTIVMVDDVANPQHPPQWFARTEQFACLCPAPFFSEEVPVASEQTLAFRYAVVVADGAADAGRAAELASIGRTTLERP